jgi:signal transduction histidine kinase
MSIDNRLKDCYVEMDALKVEQVVRNYVSNAVKFTPMNGVITVNGKLIDLDTTVDLQHERNVSNAKWYLEVVDNGAGISEENQTKLFQQYLQIDANKLQGGKGSGLGLWSKRNQLFLSFFSSFNPFFFNYSFETNHYHASRNGRSYFPRGRIRKHFLL